MRLGSWETTIEELLRGLNHSLSNRLSMVVTVGQYLQMGEANPAEIGGMLDVEATKIEQLLELLRALARAPGEEPLPFSVAACLGEVAALLAHHSPLRSTPVIIEGAEGQMPVVSDEVSVARVLLAACVAIAGEGGEQIWIQVRESSDCIVVRIATRERAAAMDDPGIRARLAGLAAGFGLDLRRGNQVEADSWTAGELWLPTLRAVREREGSQAEIRLR